MTGVVGRGVVVEVVVVVKGRYVSGRGGGRGLGRGRLGPGVSVIMGPCW